jgi:hypothetical protein
MKKFNEIWLSESEKDWNRLLKAYWGRILEDNIQIEYELNRLTPDQIKNMNANKWYQFLLTKYFVWKYTAKNRLATTTNHLKKYAENNELDQLHDIKNKILALDKTDIFNSLDVAHKIRGLGVAGASGLLSLIYPRDFGTVDQFVVYALRQVDEHKDKAEKMKAENLSLDDGVVLIKIMRKKSSEMNAKFSTSFCVNLWGRS